MGYLAEFAFISSLFLNLNSFSVIRNLSFEEFYAKRVRDITILQDSVIGQKILNKKLLMKEVFVKRKCQSDASDTSGLLQHTEY